MEIHRHVWGFAARGDRDHRRLLKRRYRAQREEMTDTRQICASCKAFFTSAQSFAGACTVCGAPICFRCWTRGTRTCAQHAVEPSAPVDAPGARSAPKPAVVCAHCGRPLPGARRRAGKPAYCRACQEELTRVPDDLPEKAVTVDRARYLETLFCRSMDDALRRLVRWPGENGAPRRTMTRGALSSLGALPQGFVSGHPLREALEPRAERLPRNASHTIELVYRSRLPWRRRKHELNVVLGSRAPLEMLLEKGYAVEPAGSQALNAAIENLSEANAGDRLVFVFSPTGWEGSLPIPDWVVLVGPGVNGGWQTRHNVREDSLRAFVAALCELESGGEQVARCAAAVVEAAPARFPLSARGVAAERGVPLPVVAEAFRRVADERPEYLVCDDPARDDWLLELK